MSIGINKLSFILHWKSEYLLLISSLFSITIHGIGIYYHDVLLVVVRRESSLLTRNLSPFLLSNSVRCKKAKSWLTCPIKTRRVSCSSYYSVVMNLTKPIQLWVMVMLLLVLCPLMIKSKNHVSKDKLVKKKDIQIPLRFNDVICN